MTPQPDLIGIGDNTPESLVEQDLRDHNSDKWPPLLAELVGVLEAALVREGVPQKPALEQALASALAVGEYLGGKLVYIPRGDRLRTALKHAKAWRTWRGDNIEEIMDLLGVCQVRAYKVLAEQRELHRGKSQGQLFNDTRGNES